MHCAVNYLLCRIEHNIQNGNRPKTPNADFKINSLIVMLKNVKSILLLVESDNIGGAFSLLRSLIESMFVYLAIYDDEGVAEEYYKFMNYRIKYESTGQYPEEFSELLSQKVLPYNYLNYGWIDSIQKKKHKYTLREVIDCSKKTDKRYNDYFLAAYKYCCKFSHGNFINQIINIDSFVWILERAGGILVNLLRQFAYVFQDTIVYNGINLEEYLVANVKQATLIFQKLTQKSNNDER